MKLEALEEEIYRARWERNLIMDDVQSIKASIKYYKQRGRWDKVKELERELKELLPRYEKAKEKVNALTREWRELTLVEEQGMVVEVKDKDYRISK